MKKILIVEDEIIIGLDIAAKLSKLGYRVTGTATRPEEAFRALEEELPDLIIMDINLKADMDGIDIAAVVKDKYGIPVIFLTSYSDTGMIDRSMKTEPYGYLIKPYTDGSLTASIKTSFTRLGLEKKITDQRNMLNNIMDSITDAVAVVKYDGIIGAANKRFGEIAGEGELTGKNISDIFEGTLTSEMVQQMYIGHSKDIIPVQAGGTDRQVLVSTSSMDSNDGSILLTITDLTEMYAVKNALSAAEKRFAKIFRKNITPAVLLTCEGMRIYEMNEAFAALYETDEGRIDSPASDFFGEGVLWRTEKEIAEDGSFRLDVVPQKTSGGREFFASFRGKKVELDGVEYYLVDVYDVTEQVKMEEMERDLQQKLIHANKMTSLGTLVSGVAHEINNPNNFIMFNSSLLMDFWTDINDHLCVCKNLDSIGGMSVEEFQEDFVKLLAGILNGSERIKNIVQDLKGFAKKEDSETFETISVSDSLNTAVRMLDHQISAATSNFSMHVEETPCIWGNSQKIDQVLINIIMNSLEALKSPEAGVEVSCRTEDLTVVVEVKDEGIGIPADALSRITEPFYTTKQADGGTGLGLAIAYNIINEHSGSIEICSESLKGTTVRIELPVHIPDEK